MVKKFAGQSFLKLIQNPLFISLLVPFPVLALTKAQQSTNADDIIPGLISTDHWTPFYWGQSRLGSLLPFLTIPIKNLSLNILIQNWIHIWFLTVFIIFISWVTSRNRRPVIMWQAVVASLVVVIHYWPKEFTGGQPYGDSFGLTAIAVYFACFYKPEQIRRWYLLASVVLIFLANWVNPLISLYSLPAYLFLFLNGNRKIKILSLFSISTLCGFGFLFYGIRSGEIRGLSAPSLAEFKNFYIYSPLLITQILAGILIVKNRSHKEIRYISVLTALSLTGWPLVVLISTINQVKANVYSDRYFIPILLHSFLLQIVALISLMNQSSSDFFGDRSVKLKKKMSLYYIVGPTILGLFAANLILIPVERRIIPLNQQHKAIEISTLKKQPHPDFIIGDYWLSWPMKLFFTGRQVPPVISYRMEGQRIFQSFQSKTLTSIMRSGAKGICFGAMNTCKDLLKFYTRDLGISQNVTLQSAGDFFIHGEEVHEVVLEQNSCWDGAELPTQIGSKAGPHDLATAANLGIQGFLTFGPYVTISPGNFTAAVTYEVSSNVGNPVAIVDRAAGGKSLLGSSMQITPSTAGKNVFKFSFKTTNTLANFEVRVFDNGSTKLQVDSICIFNTSAG